MIAPAQLPPVRRVLVTRLKFLGDVVLTTPVLRTLRAALPEASIEYLTLQPYAAALQHHPDLDRLHELPAAARPHDMLAMARSLARPRVDWWIDLMGSPRSALLCALARPRVAVGPARGFRSRVYQHRRGRPRGERSAVRHHLDKLVPLLGETAPSAVRIVADPHVRARVRAALALEPERPPVLLHPGSTWQSTAWPDRRFAELAARLHRAGVGPLWVVGSPTDLGLAGRVAQLSGVGARALAPVGLPELLALLAEARAYVGNDGGILHCAVALGTPTVAVFGPTEADIWFPHAESGPHRVVFQEVPCRPCHLHECSHLTCLRTLTAAAVEQVVLDVMRASSWKGSARA